MGPVELAFDSSSPGNSVLMTHAVHLIAFLNELGVECGDDELCTVLLGVGLLGQHVGHCGAVLQWQVCHREPGCRSRELWGELLWPCSDIDSSPGTHLSAGWGTTIRRHTYGERA